jgi:putative acetyltransferase
MKHRIDYIDKFEYKEVVEVWEASVRATHHFLKEEDIAYFKPLILNTYLDAVDLRCVRD